MSDMNRDKVVRQDVESADLVEPGRSSGSLLKEVLTWLGAIAVAGALVFWLLDGLRVGAFWPFAHHTLDGGAMYELTRSTVALTGLLGATVAVAIAIRRQRSTEESVAISSQAQLVTAEAYRLDVERHGQEQVRDLRTRFTAAAQQLGDEAAAVRLAGVYAMATLGDDWIQRGRPDEAQSCIDVLCAYLRVPRHTVTAEGKRADIEIKQTIVRAITARLQSDVAAERDWRGRDFDFTDATFDGNYTFAAAVFSGGTVSFNGATFSGGTVSFNRATFSDATVSFNRATFSGATVSFNRATFSGGMVDFNGATFSGGTVSFFGATFSGGTVSFFGATFNGATVSFGRATFSDGTVSFYEATFKSATVSFGRATFNGATASFGRATFNGATASFNRATFSDGTVSFTGTTFSDGTASFTGATFNGGTVTFRAAVFSGGGVAGLGEGGTPPEVWPPAGN